MDAIEDSTSLKRTRVEEVEEEDLVASTPPPKQGWDDFLNVEVGIAING